MINLDFADIKSVMEGQGSALIGIGMASGENKAEEAAQKAIQCPLLEASITGAKSAIVNVTGGASMSAYDAQEAVDYIRSAAGNDIDIIFGVAINDKIGESIIVTVIATGFDLPKPEAIPSAAPAAVTSPVSNQKGLEVESSSGLSFGTSGVRVEEEEDDTIPNFFSRN
jgi:cell division protein FtsZ